MNNTKKHSLTYTVTVHDYNTPAYNPRITGEHFPRYTYVNTCTTTHTIQCTMQSTKFRVGYMGMRRIDLY